LQSILYEIEGAKELHGNGEWRIKIKASTHLPSVVSKRWRHSPQGH